MCALTVALVAVGVVSIAFGAVTLSTPDAFQALWSTSDAFARVVVWEIRFPRYLDAMLVGAAMAVAGALLQVVTRNPLADPTILGVSSAAGLAVAVGLVVAPGIAGHWLTLLAVAGGLGGAGLLLVMAWGGAVSALRLTLAGVAIAAFFGAAIVGLLASSRTFLELSLGFLAGGLYGADWRDARLVAPLILPAIVVAIALAPRL
ncbi:MAG: iron chelate uptake ABC transporter family permease subunit, partial [Chloroflexi bacterium]|nr:iron chelate uptake ABC transporter family permease subunit [Chloroflexota bacterium]